MFVYFFFFFFLSLLTSFSPFAVPEVGIKKLELISGVVRYIENDLGLDGVWNMKPLFDVRFNFFFSFLLFCALTERGANPQQGTELSQILGRGPGPWLNPFTEKLIEWQLENPSKSREECREWILMAGKQ
jgi:hypothetical protein